MAEMNHSLGTIKIHCGRLVVAGYNKCEIIHADEVISYSGPNVLEIPELKFGLLTYRCDKKAGYLISPFDCKSCNLPCDGKRLIIRSCPEEETEVWAAVILAMLFIVLIGSFLCRSFVKALTSQYSNSGSYRVRYSRNSDYPNESITMNPNHNDEEATSANEPEPKSQKRDTETQSESKRENVKHPTSRKKSIGALAAGLVLNNTANACKWTVLMSSNKVENICNATVCKDTSFQYLSLLLGQEICFEDHKSNVFASVKVTEIILRSRYELMFHTFDYKTNTTVLSSDCSKSGECSKVNINCKPSKLNKSNELAVNTEKIAQGWSCDGSSKYGNSAHLCCYFFWELEMTESFPVLRRTGDIWIVKFILSQNDRSQKKTMEVSTLDPTFDLDGFGSSPVNRLLVTILNVTKENVQSNDYLLLYNGKLYYVNASDINMPSQDSNVLTVENLAYVAKVPNGVCSDPPGGAKCECDCNYFLESKISEFKTKVHDFRFEDEFSIRKNDFSIIDTFVRLHDGSITVKLDDWNSLNSTLEYGKCDIDHVLTHGCTSCEEGSYMVFVSQNVEKEGPMPFISNCSFDKLYVNCDKFKPTKLKFKEEYQTCILEVPTLNKTILINVEYFDLSFQADLMKNLNSAGVFSKYLECFFKSESAIKSFFASLSLLSISIIIVAVVFRFFYMSSRQTDAEN